MAIPLDDVPVTQEPTVRVNPKQLHTVFGRALVPGQISLIHGPERGHLTMLAHTVVLAGSRFGQHSAYLDSGKNFNPDLVRRIAGAWQIKKGIDDLLKRIHVAEVVSLDHIRPLSKSLHTDRLSVIVIDSLTRVLNLSTDPGTKTRQRQLFAALEGLRDLVNSLGVHLLVTSHSRADWKTGELRPIGGNVLEHDIDSVFRVTGLESPEKMVQVTVEKSPAVATELAVVVRVGKYGLKSIRSMR